MPVSFVIPKRKYIKDTFNAETFEILTGEVLVRRDVKDWAKKNKVKIGGYLVSEYQEQKKVKPAIEETVNKHLDGKLKNDLLDFVFFLRDNKMSPQWGSTNSYNLSYKGRRVCIIKIAEKSYQIWLNTQYNEDFNKCFSEDTEENKKFLIDSIIYCFGCGSCKPGLDIDILDVSLKGVCFNPVIRMENPDERQIELAKKLVLLRRQAIYEGKAPKVTYISQHKR